MEIKKLDFERKEVQIRETYEDESGKIRDRIKTVLLPTGNLIAGNELSPDPEEKKEG